MKDDRNINIGEKKKSVKWQRVPSWGICSPQVLLVSPNMSESWRCATSGENLLQPLAATTNLAFFHPSFPSSFSLLLLTAILFLFSILYFCFTQSVSLQFPYSVLICLRPIEVLSVWSPSASFHLAYYHTVSGQQPRVHIRDLMTQA